VTFIFGVGKAAEQRLARDGLRTIGDLQRINPTEMMRRYGVEGDRLARLARGIDNRTVSPDREAKSVSSETTFNRDIKEFRSLEKRLWRLCEKVALRLKAKALAGTTITLKLKTAEFRLRTRARSLDHPTQLAARIFAAGRDMLAHEVDGTPFRLIGIGLSGLTHVGDGGFEDLLDRRAADAEHAIDRLRGRFGHAAVIKGLEFESDTDD
jgi:DNA polymerase-4